jgi:hypothetical protein
MLGFDRQACAALPAIFGSDHETVRLCVDQSALRFVHQIFAFSQTQSQLLQFAIGSFKFNQSDRSTTASIIFKSRLDDHPHHCLPDCSRDNKRSAKFA